MKLKFLFSIICCVFIFMKADAQFGGILKKKKDKTEQTADTTLTPADFIVSFFIKKKRKESFYDGS